MSPIPLPRSKDSCNYLVIICGLTEPATTFSFFFFGCLPAPTTPTHSQHTAGNGSSPGQGSDPRIWARAEGQIDLFDGTILWMFTPAEIHETITIVRSQVHSPTPPTKKPQIALLLSGTLPSFITPDTNLSSLPVILSSKMSYKEFALCHNGVGGVSAVPGSRFSPHPGAVG